jgi:hypothetical protein
MHAAADRLEESTERKAMITTPTSVQHVRPLQGCAQRQCTTTLTDRPEKQNKEEEHNQEPESLSRCRRKNNATEAKLARL